MEYSPKKMKHDLDKNGFKFKKKFGQNFIIDENIIKNIIRLSEIDKDTLVIEIGAGSGSLTTSLAVHAGHVICFEIDLDLIGILDKNLEGKENVLILFEDFLKTDLNKIISDYEFMKHKKLYIVSNLPYYITTPILMKIIEDKIDVDKIVIMVQKEVGNRFKALPNTKEYNSLSIFLQYYFDIKKIMDVSKNVFIPKPNVDSIVVEFNKRNKEEVPDIFFDIVKDSFKQKRKTIKNNLSNYDLVKIEKVLVRYGYDLSVRAEQLHMEVFIDISRALKS